MCAPLMRSVRVGVRCRCAVCCWVVLTVRCTPHHERSLSLLADGIQHDDKHRLTHAPAPPAPALRATRQRLGRSAALRCRLAATPSRVPIGGTVRLAALQCRLAAHHAQPRPGPRPRACSGAGCHAAAPLAERGVTRKQPEPQPSEPSWQQRVGLALRSTTPRKPSRKRNPQVTHFFFISQDSPDDCFDGAPVHRPRPALVK